MLSRSTIFLGLMLTGSLALASFMREDVSPSSEVVLPAARASAARTNAVGTAAYPQLPLEKLARAGLSDPEHNPFAGKSWNVPRELPPVVAGLKKDDPPAAAPSIPFKYMGRLQEEGGRTLVFFSQGSQAFSVREGQDIDGTYRLERVTPTELGLVYLPSKTRQTIEVSSLEADLAESPEDALKAASLAHDREPQMKPQMEPQMREQLQEAARDER